MIYDFASPTDVRRACLSRYGAWKTERTSWLSHWQDIATHVMPRNLRAFTTDRNRSDKAAYNKIYDNTASRALRTLGAGMMAGTSNPGRPWFRLTTSNPELRGSHRIRVWLDAVVTRMQRVFAKSNTYRTLHMMYEELGAFGTSASLLLFDTENVIHHYPIPLGEFVLQKDWRGQIVGFAREFETTVGELVTEFGLQQCSLAVQHKWKVRELEATVQVLHLIERRSDQQRDPHSPLSKDMPWRSVHIELGGDDDKLLRDAGFEVFPVLAPRWSVIGGDVYGSRCPGMESLGDVRQLQQEQIMKGTGIAQQVKPALQVPTTAQGRDGVLLPGGVSYMDPGTMLPYDQVTASGGVRRAFDVNLDLNHLLLDIQDVRERINSSYYADLFLMLAMSGPQTRMTATEVAERHEEKLLALGPVLERLHNELLQPLIDITFRHMLRSGALPPAPSELAGEELTVEFVSILAQAQRAIGSNSIDRFVGSIMAVAPVRPDVLDKVNFDKWVDTYGDMLGVDAGMIVPDEDAAALRKARAEAQAAEAQLAAQGAQAKAAKDAAGAVATAPGAMDALGMLSGSAGME